MISRVTVLRTAVALYSEHTFGNDVTACVDGFGRTPALVWGREGVLGLESEDNSAPIIVC